MSSEILFDRTSQLARAAIWVLYDWPMLWVPPRVAPAPVRAVTAWRDLPSVSDSSRSFASGEDVMAGALGRCIPAFEIDAELSNQWLESGPRNGSVLTLAVSYLCSRPAIVQTRETAPENPRDQCHGGSIVF